MIDDIKTRWNIKSIKGHKECKGALTECPGRLMEIVKEQRMKSSLEIQVSLLTRIIGLLKELNEKIKK